MASIILLTYSSFWTHDPVTFYIIYERLAKGFSKIMYHLAFLTKLILTINLYLRGTHVYVETWGGSLKWFFK